MGWRIAVGAMLVIAGAVCAAWGVGEMRTLKWRFLNDAGRPDYTAPIVTGAGGLMAVLGIGLAISKK